MKQPTRYPSSYSACQRVTIRIGIGYVLKGRVEVDRRPGQRQTCGGIEGQLGCWVRWVAKELRSLDVAVMQIMSPPFLV